MGAPQQLIGPIVLFDGVCTLCNRTVDFIVQHDPARRFRFGSLQSSASRALLEKFDCPTDSLESVVLIDQGKVYTKSDAALRIAREVAGPWRLLAVFRIVPRGIRDHVYDWIARHRYAWFGRKDTCRVPTDAEKQLFLE